MLRYGGTNVGSPSFMSAMVVYRGYMVKVERADRKWRCLVSPTRRDLSILWCPALYYETEAEAVVDAKRRVDEILAT